MPGVEEIRVKIASFKSTQKITKAMEMVAASKMRKAQERMRASRPYAERIRRVIGHLRLANPEYKHPFMLEREAKSVGFIIITTDRGLAGGSSVRTTLPLPSTPPDCSGCSVTQVFGMLCHLPVYGR